MYEAVRSLLLAGLGAAVVTKDKVMEMTRSFVEQGKLSAAEAEKLAEDLAEESRRQAKGLGEKIEAGARKTVETLGLVGRAEYELLLERVARLEERLAALEARVGPAEPAE
ncbi:MAG: phasin family protein [Thermodesulfobacteriota bacterium]